MNKTKVIIVIGATGAGKGTQCKLISQKTGIIHLSTGDLCREAVRLNNELGQKVGEYLQQGDMVPDELMIEVMNDRLKQPDAKTYGVLLDGYPRTKKQTKALLDNRNINIDRVILIQTTDNLCTERILGRRVDPLTGQTYNIVYPE